MVAFFNDKFEFGDRALGARSNFSNPLSKNIKDIVNKSIKYREKYGPSHQQSQLKISQNILIMIIVKIIFIWKGYLK